MLRIFYDDFEKKVKNIHDEMELHHSYKKKRVFSSRFSGRKRNNLFKKLVSISLSTLSQPTIS